MSGGPSDKQESNAGSWFEKSKSGLCKCGAWLGDFGLEPTLELYIEHSMAVLDEVWRVLRKDGTCWWNLGDSYNGQKVGNTETEKYASLVNSDFIKPLQKNGLKPKDLCLVPFRFALAAQQRGWWIRSAIIWSKPNPMPESVSSSGWSQHKIYVGEKPNRKRIDCPGCEQCLPHGGLYLYRGSWRPTDAFEFVFLMTKSENYWTDAEAVREKISQSYADDKRPHGVLRQRFYENSSYVKAGMVKAGDGPFPDGERATGRNLRNVWQFATEAFPSYLRDTGSHFACFPEELPRRCILAGCPEKVCAKCGTGWVRILETNYDFLQKTNNKRSNDQNNFGDMPRMNKNTKTLGWKPACDCYPHACPPENETKKGIVLDPFSGSGTVVDVAIRSGRIGIGVELSPDYIRLAQKRTENSRKQGALL